MKRLFAVLLALLIGVLLALLVAPYVRAECVLASERQNPPRPHVRSTADCITFHTGLNG